MSTPADSGGDRTGTAGLGEPWSPGSSLSRWLPVLGWMALIFLLSAQPGLRVSDDANVDRPIRTLAHLASYAVLAALLVRALATRGGPTRVAAFGAWVVAVLYGVSDEIHQSFVPDRTGRPSDVLIDAIGAAIGVALAVILLSAIERRRRRAGSPAESARTG
jgi:VanZ family protein